MGIANFSAGVGAVPISSPPISSSPAPSTDIDRQALNLTHAIALAESGSKGKPNYNAVGDNGTSTGAYQWNGAGHFASDAKAAGLDPNDFSPQNQDKVAYAKVKKLKDEGKQPAEIASIWNSGQPQNYQNHSGVTNINGQMIHYDTPAYVQKVKQYYTQLNGAYNPTPYSSGQIDLADKQTVSDAPQGLVEGALNAAKGFAVGTVKGTGQLLNDISNPIADALTGKKSSDAVQAGNAADFSANPNSNSEKAGVVTGKYALPGLAAATTAGMGATAAGLDLPALAGQAKNFVGKNWWKGALLYELVKGKDVKSTAQGLIKLLE